MNKIFEVFTPPFKLDKQSGYILDADNNICLEVRGWGKFQYKTNPELLQDKFGEFVAECINKATKPTDNTGGLG